MYGGTWLDTDVACINHLNDDEIIFSSEPVRSEPFWHPDLAVVRTPPKHPVIESCVIQCENLFREHNLKRGLFGPKLFKETLEKHNQNSLQFVNRACKFCPYGWWLAPEMYQPYGLPIPVKSITIHLWNNYCLRNNIKVNYPFHDCSMVELLWEYLGVK
jgi:hypothetical protein